MASSRVDCLSLKFSRLVSRLLRTSYRSDAVILLLELAVFAPANLFDRLSRDSFSLEKQAFALSMSLPSAKASTVLLSMSTMSGILSSIENRFGAQGLLR